MSEVQRIVGPGGGRLLALGTEGWVGVVVSSVRYRHDGQLRWSANLRSIVDILVKENSGCYI